MTKIKILFVLIMATTLYYNTAMAVSIKSNRTVFNENNQTKTLTINNTTDKAQSYSIEFLHYKMQGEKGRLKPIPKDVSVKNINWADNMIKISPSKVTIPPHSKQQVTLSIIPSSNKINGEYRTHLSVKTEIDVKTQDIFATVAETGIITPVFIRYGEFNVKTDIKDVVINKKDNGEYSTNFILTRLGNRSIYGSIDIACIMNKENKSLKEVHGIAIYTEITQKRMTLNFNIPNNLQKECKELELKYISIPSDNLFKGRTMSSINIKIPDILEN